MALYCSPDYQTSLSQLAFRFLIVLGFHYMSALVGHFMSSPREREKRNRRDSRGIKERDREERRKLIDCVGVYNTSTLVGQFVSSPREMEKRERQ